MADRRRAAAVLLGAVVVVGSCSSDARQSVRADGTVVDDETQLDTDASTTSAPTTSPPGTAAAPPTSAGTDDDLTGPVGITPGAATATSLVPVPEVAPTGASLGVSLLEAGPVGWVRVLDDAPSLGALTVDQAAAALGDREGELALLETRRLRAAHARAWDGPGGTRATLVGYAFADREGALAYEIDSYLALVASGAAESTGPMASRAFRSVVDGTVVEGRSLRDDERLYVVVVRGAPAAVADALVLAQAMRAGL